MNVAVWLFGCSSALDFDDLAASQAQSTENVTGTRSGDLSYEDECKAYCDAALELCTERSTIYLTREACLALCSHLPTLDPSASGVQSALHCRAAQLVLAEQTGEPLTYCPRAAIGGTGTCEDDCDTYCGLLQAICPDDFAASGSHCDMQCWELQDHGAFSVEGDHDGDTLQCRLSHLISATIDPDTHCGHARIDSTLHCVSP